MKMKTIKYCFILKDGSKEIFNINLDDKTLELIESAPKDLPEWAKLDFYQYGSIQL